MGINSLSGYYLAYFTKRYGFFDYRRGWLKGDCPKCGREQKCGVHIATDRINCFICGYAKSLEYVVMDLEKLSSKKQVKDFLKNFKYTKLVKPQAKELKPANVILPDGFTMPRIARSNPLSKQITKYLVSRGLSEVLIKQKRIGFVSNNTSEWFGYIIFPYYRKRTDLYYFQGRTFMDLFPKFKNPDEDILGIGKSQVIYNEDALWRQAEVDITESVINALTMGRTGISIGGKIISPWQKNQLTKCPVELYNIMLDPDAWGRAIKLAEDLVMAGKKVRILKFFGEEDVNSLGKSKTRELLKSQDTIYTNIMDISQIKYGAVNY